jgi:hypothetical protein
VSGPTLRSPAPTEFSPAGASIVVHPVGAQEVGPQRVGVILQGGPWYAVVDGLREGLNQAGYVEGKRYVLDIRDTRRDLKAVEEAERNVLRGAMAQEKSQACLSPPRG